MPVDDQAMRGTAHAYLDAFERSDSEPAAALFAENTAVEDPVGTPLKRGAGRDPGILRRVDRNRRQTPPLRPDPGDRVLRRLRLDVRLHHGGADLVIEVIDVLRFDEAGRISEMKAYFGFSNMRGA